MSSTASGAEGSTRPGLGYCLRCKTEPLRYLEIVEAEGISYDCPKCKRPYVQKPDKALCFRWRHPISLVLYPVIYDNQPSAVASEMAEDFARLHPAIEGEAVIREIELELEEPTQQVRDILNSTADESECRLYLKLVAEQLKRLLAGTTG